MIRTISFRNRKGLTLKGYIHEPKRYDTAVIFCHGFPSNADGTTGRRIGHSFSRLGYLVMRFHFSHTPPSEGVFEDKLMSREAADIGAAIDFLENHYTFRKLILVGHSTGAIDAALYAHKDKRISKLVLSGAVSHLDNAARYDFTDRQMRDFLIKGYIVYNRPGAWVHRKKLKQAFYDEFFTLNIPHAIKKYRKPLLIIHGEHDEAIPSRKDPRQLYALAHKPKKLIIIKGADHSFTKRNHWKHFVAVVDRFIRF